MNTTTARSEVEAPLTTKFAAVADALSNVTRHHPRFVEARDALGNPSLQITFRTPPRGSADRAVSRDANGSFTVAVRTRDRHCGDWIEDMVEGVMAGLRMDDDPKLRAELIVAGMRIVRPPAMAVEQGEPF